MNSPAGKLCSSSSLIYCGPFHFPITTRARWLLDLAQIIGQSWRIADPASFQETPGRFPSFSRKPRLHSTSLGSCRSPRVFPTENRSPLEALRCMGLVCYPPTSPNPLRRSCKNACVSGATIATSDRRAACSCMEQEIMTCRKQSAVQSIHPSPSIPRRAQPSCVTALNCYARFGAQYIKIPLTSPVRAVESPSTGCLSRENPITNNFLLQDSSIDRMLQYLGS